VASWVGQLRAATAAQAAQAGVCLVKPVLIVRRCGRVQLRLRIRRRQHPPTLCGGLLGGGGAGKPRRVPEPLGQQMHEGEEMMGITDIEAAVILQRLTALAGDHGYSSWQLSATLQALETMLPDMKVPKGDIVGK
jgi:hypothetical protein